MDTHRLTRDLSDRMVAGVCSGLAQYLAIDVTLVRLFFVLLALGDGIGILLYVLLWITMPAHHRDRGVESNRDRAVDVTEEMVRTGQGMSETVFHPDARTKLLIGLALVILGVIYLLENLNIPGMGWFDIDVLWPILLIVGGIVFLVRQGRYR